MFTWTNNVVRHAVSDLQPEYDSCLVAKDDSLLGTDPLRVALSLACGRLYELYQCE